MSKIGEVLYDKCPMLANEASKLKYWLLKGVSYGIEYHPRKDNPYKLLMLVSCRPNATLTIRQTIYQLVEHSVFTIDLLNVWGGVPRINAGKINEYDAIILHNTVSYTRKRLDVMDALILKKFEGIKILMKQDEHHKINQIVEFVKKSKIDLVLSLWDEETAKRMYAPEPQDKVEVMQYLTGYVPDSYRHLDYNLQGRRIDVGYRGSIHPITYGRLCYEKQKIGEDFMPYALKRGLCTDISNRAEDIIPGEAWLDFLGNCKSVLGVESGTCLVDFDGEVETAYKKYLIENPQASDEEVLSFLEPYEHRMSYCVISPRHFEAAACKTLQVMYEGEFQGIFKANRHYLPLKRDYSNVEEVLDGILDDKLRKNIVECAFEEIIMNEEYSFTTFIKRFDGKILELLERR